MCALSHKSGRKSAKVEKNLLIKGNKVYNLTSKATFKAFIGDKLVIKTPGGGGWRE